MKTLQISKDVETNNINVYESHNKRIGQLNVMNFGAAFSWNGKAVTAFFLDVLTDCNYHTERKAIEQTLKNLER